MIRRHELLRDNRYVSDRTRQSFKQFCEFFNDLVLQDIRFLHYRQHVLAGAIICAARMGAKLQKIWPSELASVTGLPLSSIRQCFEDILLYYERVFPDNSVTKRYRSMKQQASYSRVQPPQRR